jgi:sugar lactone lactonase YvrE
MALCLEWPVRRAVDVRNVIGESPLWSGQEQALYWVDIPCGLVYRWHPRSGARFQWQMPSAVGSIGLRAGGGLVVALRTGIHFFDTTTGELTLVHQPERHLPANRLNDGKVSPEGRFWVGSMDDSADKQPVASLYRLDADRSCHAAASGLRVSNGLAWSPDGRTMYHADSRAATIWRYAYEPATGAIGTREVFVRMQPEWGRPDGAAVDDEGCYWSCGVSAGRINRFSPKGELLAWVPMPVTHPTMPCFGGADGRSLYVTSLSEGLDDQAGAGAVFVVDVDVAGPPAALYRS